jgi:hypothetical protein
MNGNEIEMYSFQVATSAREFDLRSTLQIAS